MPLEDNNRSNLEKLKGKKIDHNFRLFIHKNNYHLNRDLTFKFTGFCLLTCFFFQIYIGITRVSDLKKETFNLIPDVNISLWCCNVGKGKHGNLPEQGQYHNKVDVSPLRLASKGIKAFLLNTSNKMAHATKVCLLKSSIANSVVHQFWERNVHTVVNCS